MSQRLLFFKSSLCADATCVEVARLGNRIWVKDQSVVLGYSLEEWSDFVQHIKQGEFDFGLEDTIKLKSQGGHS